MNTKICLYCSVSFNKKCNYSKKYWERAKYCSMSCGRKAHNPAKLNPNKYEIEGEILVLLVQSKNQILRYLLDKDVFLLSPQLKNNRWSVTSYGYLETTSGKTEKRVKTYLHHLILPRKEGFVVDHINGDAKDNRKSNLRYLTHKNNIRNQKTRNIHGMSGIRLAKSGNYSVRIKIDEGSIGLGTYKSLKEAKRIRIEAEIKYWGQSFSEARCLV